jgi:hypothetical protein
MRCLSCDVALSDREATRKSLRTGDFIDLCDECFSTIEDQVLTINNPTLSNDRGDIYGRTNTRTNEGDQGSGD